MGVASYTGDYTAESGRICGPQILKGLEKGSDWLPTCFTRDAGTVISSGSWLSAISPSGIELTLNWRGEPERHLH
jgi:hypothetical protein